MLRKLTLASMTALFLLIAAPAWACGGLVAPNGTINLLRTSTLAAYVRGVEHYITSFEFAGGGAEFGSIVPLPGVPTKVERAGDWTLQRLVQEVTPVRNSPLFSADAATAEGTVQVILEARIDALDITVLKGGGFAVGKWAADNGFNLPPDAPEVLDFYATRSPIFMAARFDATEARKRGQDVGDGTPIHLTIPTPNPWVPLRILGLGRLPDERIEADVFLLTEREPALLPSAGEGYTLERSERASSQLLADLSSDKGMGWMPTDGLWFSYLKIDAAARQLRYDLAVDATGADQPSPLAAGLPVSARVAPDTGFAAVVLGGGLLALAAALVLLTTRRAMPARP